ncbi:MAG: hypothetical protein COU67_04100 [Candidatus Pacebacteria bacterium CG10_big_fil_rev_8_21_14_0_10_44_54]|nr:MAG: hypothetical protein COU67_04100 [Candidatus Pacebacteria bacterium CG10_big_fil_rev_8_21_14_0_10_44_54]
MKKLYFPILFLAFFSIFLAHYFVSGQAVYGDGIGYYAYLHSWYFDADADFTNEYKHIYNQENNNSQDPQTAEVVQIVGTNATGQALNHFSPGMAILLLPFYVLADGIVIIANVLRASLARSGYSDVYQIMTGMGAILYVVISMWLSERILQRCKLSHFISRVAVFLLFFATCLLYYGSFDVLNSHFASYFLSVLFLYHFFTLRKIPQLKQYFFLGCIAGLLGLTRPQDALIGIVVLLDIWRRVKRGDVSWPQAARRLMLFVFPAVIIFALLVFQWITTFDTFDTHPYFLWMNSTSEHGPSFDFFGSLFHPSNGLLTRTPIVFVALVFFFYLVKKRKTTYILQLLFVFFCLQFVLISLQGGWSAAAYGGRMYISSLPFFLLLLAMLLSWLRQKFGKHMLFLVMSFFVCLNVLSIASFVLFEKGVNGGRQVLQFLLKSEITAKNTQGG